MSVGHETENKEIPEMKTPVNGNGEVEAGSSNKYPAEGNEDSEPVELTGEQLKELFGQLNQELEASKQRAESYYRRLLRMEADFENFRRRTRAEKAELELYAAERVITGLLPVLDNLERALKAAGHSRDLDSLIQGLDLVHRGFKDILDREGLKVMDVLGQDFDPELHEALAQVSVEEAGKADNTVVEEFQKGYLLKGRVIRPARVAVAKELTNGGETEGENPAD